MAVWNTLDAHGRPVSYRLEPDLNATLGPLWEPFRLHFGDHPFVWRLGLARRVLEREHPFVLSDHMSARQLAASGLWNEVLFHLSVQRQLAFSGRLDGDCSWTISANRVGADYGPRDRELARYLKPRLARIVRAVARRDHVADAGRTLETVFRHADAAYALIAPDGRCAHVTETARAHLAKVPGGVGPDGLPAACGELRRLLQRPADARGGTPRLFTFLQLSGAVSGVVLWLPAGGAVLLLQAAPAPAASAQLTRRENEILGWLGEGKTNAEIGLLLGVSPRTVEKHCGNLFAKLGVESRFAAGLLATSSTSGLDRRLDVIPRTP